MKDTHGSGDEDSEQITRLQGEYMLHGDNDNSNKAAEVAMPMRMPYMFDFAAIMYRFSNRFRSEPS